MVPALTPNPSTSSAAIRRVRQNKSPKTKVPIRKLWSILAQPWPYSMVARPQDNAIHYFVQQVDLGTLYTTSTSVAVGTGLSFALSSVPNSGSFTSLFDQYKIIKIELWLSAPVNGSGTAGNFFSAIDYDAANSLTLTQIQQYSNVLTSPITNGHYHAFTPHVAVAAYGGATFSAYSNVTSPWIDSNSPSVPHFGLTSVSEPTPSGTFSINVTARFHLQFRNVI